MLGSKLNHVSKSRPGADWGILVSNLGIYKIRKQYPSIELFLQFEFPSRKNEKQQMHSYISGNKNHIEKE